MLIIVFKKSKLKKKNILNYIYYNRIILKKKKENLLCNMYLIIVYNWLPKFLWNKKFLCKSNN